MHGAETPQIDHHLDSRERGPGDAATAEPAWRPRSDQYGLWLSVNEIIIYNLKRILEHYGTSEFAIFHA